MPKLWNETIEAHRRGVREAILDTTVALVAEHGLRSVTMSQIAEETGIGRATLYKYFPGVEEILLAWHAEHINGHLEHLARCATRPATLADASPPCSRPTRSLPTTHMGITTANSRPTCIETSRSSERNITSAAWLRTF